MKLSYWAGKSLFAKQILKKATVKTVSFCAAVTLVGLSSCDPLGLEPTSAVFDDQFWKNTQLARAFTFKFYTWNPVAADSYFTAEQWSDNAIGGDETDFASFRQTAFTHRWYDPLTSIDGFSAPWGDQLKNIRATNMGIERIPTVPGITEADKNQLLADCYFFRAWLYFELEQYWGVAPYIDRVLSVFDETMLPQLNREQLFDKILEDMDKAMELLTLSGVKPQLGLINIDAIQTIKSRVALYAACAADASKKGLYEKQNGSEATKALFRFTKTSDVYYQIAYTAAKSVMGKYTLENDYRKLFNTTEGHKSKEVIWPVMFNKDNRSGFNPAAQNGPRSPHYGSSPEFDKSWDIRGSAFPTQDLVDCYYQKDAADGKWKQWWKTKQAVVDLGVTVDAEGNFKGSSENYGLMYTDRDKRFYATILYDGSYYAGVEKEMYLMGTWIDLSTPQKTEKYSALHTGFRKTEKLAMPVKGESANTITGYYPAKYLPGTFNDDGTLKTEQTSISYYRARYAEVLLNYAEAAIKLNKEGEAKSAIDEIRGRAGLDMFDPAVVNHNLWEEYKLQRRIEFAYEVPGHRYFDLLRWSEAEGKTTIEELNRGPKAMLIYRKGVESIKIGEVGYPVAKGEPGYFTPHFETVRFTYSRYNKKFDNAAYYTMPMSQTTLQNNKKFVQTPGWEGRLYK